MPFKVKDLMVNVLPSGQQNETHDPLRRVGTILPTLGAQGCFVSMVMACNETHPYWTSPPPGDHRSVEDLANLREQLKQQLAEVEKQHAAAEESLRPQTVEDVDMLTKKLTDALDELKIRRAELAKKSK